MVCSSVPDLVTVATEIRDSQYTLTRCHKWLHVCYEILFITSSLRVAGQNLLGQEPLTHLGLLEEQPSGAGSHGCPVVPLGGKHGKEQTALMNRG